MNFSYFLIVVFSTIFSSTASQKHQKTSDMVALMAFNNNSIHTDPNSFLRNWRMSSSVNACSWNGVTCSPDNQVTSLNLTNAGLIGSLRIDDLMVLESLQDVYLRGNSFSGSLANSSPSLPCKFKTIDLSSNNFSTPISNGFLSSCNHLSSLNLSNNRITGGIPGFIGNLKSLQELSLADNQFSGEIPFELGWTCETLRELDLSGNQLSGGFPSSFNSCSSLQILNIGNNQLSGNVPYGFCSSSSSLQKLFLHSNVLSGFIPHEFGSCMNLTYIDLSLNSLSGSVPSEVWELPNLSNFVVWGNKLTGEIPQRICASSSKLETLIMNHNLITGTIPASLTKCTSLVWVSVSNNRLTGVIPHEIGNLKNLAILEMYNNSFTGDIPAEIGDCQSLIWLNLKHNHLTGFIPPQLANQAGLVMPRNFPLKKIAFIRNEGTKNCEETATLLYPENILTGRIADFIRRHSSCKSTRVYTSTSFYSFTENGTMIYLDLSYNSLEGSLPDGFGSMVYLQVLNLGHNRLTGTIPHSLGDLKEIGVLDLSHNYLKGFIPSSLGQLSFLSDLDLSNNKLEGTIPSRGQLSTFSASRYENNSGLCGIPLPPCNSAHYSPPEKLKQQHTEVGVIISIVLGYAVGFNIFAYVLIFKKSWRSVYFKYIEDRYNQLFLKKRR